MNKVNFNPNSIINNIFDEIFNTSIGDIIGSDFINSSPSVNISEEDKFYRLELAAPGLDKSNFSISVEDEKLIIESKVEKESTGEKNESPESKFTRREFYYGNFKRSFPMPKHVELNKISAEYVDGILSVHIPKVETEITTSKSIEIN